MLVVGPLSLLLTLAALDVRGTASCPTPAEVTERAIPLIPQGSALGPGHFVEIDEIPREAMAAPAARDGGAFFGGGIDIRLRSPSAAAPLVARRVPRTGSCGALAEAAAAILATWAARYDTSEVSRPPTEDARQEVASERTAAGAARSTQPPAIASSRASAAERGLTWAVGGSLWMAGASRGGLAPTAGAEVSVQRAAHSRWFGRLFAGATAERDVPIAVGRAQWSRVLLAPSIGARWGDVLVFEASGGPIVAPVWVQGEGFSPNETNWAVDVGLSAALRLGFGFGPKSRLFAWSGASAIFWIRPHRLSVAMASDAATVPPADVLVGIGGGYRFGR